jgi:hypothetical protein
MVAVTPAALVPPAISASFPSTLPSATITWPL